MAKKTNLYSMEQDPNQEGRIRKALNLLELGGMVGCLSEVAKRSLENQATPYDFLEDLLEEEIVCKEDRRKRYWIQQAKFPCPKSLAEFDFSFQPSINEQQINELASCRFIEQAENIVFFGPPGVGKTHLAIALGMQAIDHGFDVRFINIDKLVEIVEKATGADKYQICRTLCRPKLLIVDGIDAIDSVSKEVGWVLNQVFRQRYEKGSTIITSNLLFSSWNKLFSTRELANGAIDRSVHHVTVLKIDGESYRARGLRMLK